MKRVYLSAALASLAVACGTGNSNVGIYSDEGDGDADDEDTGDDENDDDSDDDSTDDGGMGPKLDVGPGDGDGDGDGCGCGQNLDFSYIWIANSGQSTVSKIDTVEMVEKGRYLTRADGAGNPSRTSVSFDGDVAVANRHGGLMKVYARESDCVDQNGQDGIQTSNGAGEVMPWGEDECIAWYLDSPSSNQRPVAWAQGQPNQETCHHDNAKVWTVMSTVPSFPGTGGFGGVTVWRVDGDSGELEDEVDIETFSGFQLGAYGGAVDPDGNLYFSPMGGVALPPRMLARVDGDTLAYQLYEMPQGVASYGITVDSKGRVWVSSTLGAGAARFDPDTETWDTVNAATVSTGGLAQDENGWIWVSSGNPNGAVAFDADSMQMTDSVVIPTNASVKGVAVDGDGFLWLVSDSAAHRFDPNDGYAVETYNGLTEPYTYSDMTGWALHNTSCPPEG
jgi:hypothetical protein